MEQLISVAWGPVVVFILIALIIGKNPRGALRVTKMVVSSFFAR